MTREKQEIYTHSIYLTFDIDWACDEVINDTLSIINEEGIAATFFVTHYTDCLKILRGNPYIELGVHPNFNQLLNGEHSSNGIEHILESLRDIVPEAKSIRSHSLVQSSKLLDEFCYFGFTHEVNIFIPTYTGIVLSPFKYINGITRVPYVWEDSAHCIAITKNHERDWDVNRFLDYQGIKVFNFHPIHVFLNTENLKRYETSRNSHKDVVSLKKYVNESSDGTRHFLKEIISEAKWRNYEFKTIKGIEV